MPLHKLNQAKNTSYQKTRKLCTFLNVSFYVNKCLPAHLQPQICAHTNTRLCTSCSHWNIQTNKCLFGWCEAVAPRSVCVQVITLFQKNTHTKKLTPSNGIENSFPMMDDVIYFLCICEYIYIYIPKHTVYCVRVSHTYALDCVYRCKVTFRSVM